MPVAFTSAMRVADIVALLPESEALLRRYGMHCAGCSMNMEETLAEGCAMHGFDDADTGALLVELNEMLHGRPARPQALTVTKEAAVALRDVVGRQGKAEAVLEVGVDERGGFSMDMLDAAAEGTLVFAHREVPEVRVSASPLTLSRIGGATVDFREGRFKLDLPEDAAQGCACKNGGTCGCAQ